VIEVSGKKINVKYVPGPCWECSHEIFSNRQEFYSPRLAAKVFLRKAFSSRYSLD